MPYAQQAATVRCIALVSCRLLGYLGLLHIWADCASALCVLPVCLLCFTQRNRIVCWSGTRLYAADSCPAALLCT